MTFRTYLPVPALASRRDDPSWVILDCRYELADPDAGERAYLEAHIPGAQYAHLDRDLSVLPSGTNGRHPLPSQAELRSRFSAWGITDGTQVVAYDGGNGMAARLWWCLRWLGHAAVAVLEGGWPAWVEAGGPVRPGAEHRPPAAFKPGPRLTEVVDAGALLEMHRILDARAPERYRGEVEPIDQAAGHIPGAINLPWGETLDERGHPLPAEEMRKRLLAALDGVGAEQAAAYCGSGVTACNLILAAEHGGLGTLRLYPGSWSEWSSDPTRPIATGAQP